ncbi:hypothetical protein CsatB_010518 [Cannabis sativa]
MHGRSSAEACTLISPIWSNQDAPQLENYLLGLDQLIHQVYCFHNGSKPLHNGLYHIIYDRL